MSKAYDRILTQAQWQLLEPLIPPAKPGGRPRQVDIWEVLNAIFYVLCQGCTWRNLPGDFPNWQTVYTYFRNWRFDRTWVKIHDRLYTWTRVDYERDPSPSEAIVDSQSVESATMVSQAVGYDAAKQLYWAQTPFNGGYPGVGVASAGHSSQCARARRRQTCLG